VNAPYKPDRVRGGDVGLRRKAAVLTCVIAIIAFVLGALFGDRGILHLIDKKKRAEQLEQEIARLDAENRRLASEIQALGPEALRSDPRPIEAIAREQLGLARSDETVFLIEKANPR
jgi:cell division protein FtsB